MHFIIEYTIIRHEARAFSLTGYMRAIETQKRRNIGQSPSDPFATLPFFPRRLRMGIFIVMIKDNLVKALGPCSH